MWLKIEKTYFFSASEIGRKLTFFAPRRVGNDDRN